MPIDFHAEQNRYSYANREADSSWQTMLAEIIDVQGRNVVDIGCGGGIYTQALVEMGAAHVTGIDFSEAMLKSAREQCSAYPNVNFSVGNALATGLPAASYDLVLERALTHHLQPGELPLCFAEAARILKAGGIVLIQNRTPEDCMLPGSVNTFRGYFFECFPRLLEKEIGRRPSSAVVVDALQQVGFQDIQERSVWERRRVYANLHALADDLLQRTGRSILHELNDEELRTLVNYVREKLQDQQGEIVEMGRWTVWVGRKGHP